LTLPFGIDIDARKGGLLNDGERLRTPPRERFAGRSHVFSLEDALAELRAEEHPARDGHRQITLFHRAPVTQVLFAFEPDGHLDKHSAPGLVTIHALGGQLNVKADHLDNELAAGDVLILDPDLPHDVRAGPEGAAMLLTVHIAK
jgi:quercetin dioxygenase-like cupin family protein